MACEAIAAGAATEIGSVRTEFGSVGIASATVGTEIGNVGIASATVGTEIATVGTVTGG